MDSAFPTGISTKNTNIIVKIWTRVADFTSFDEYHLLVLFCLVGFFI